MRREVVQAGQGALLLVVASLVPARAEAHLVTTGLGPILDGMAHFILTPDDLVPVVLMALLAGLNGTQAARYALFTLPAAWLGAALVASLLPAPALPGEVTTAFFLVLGLLTALDRKLSARIVAGIAALLGLLLGWSNGADLSPSGPGSGTLVGIAGAIFVLVALAAALGVSLRRPWMRVAARVAGSWVAAMGILLLGWRLRGAP